MEARDVVEQIEECAKLITQNNNNKDLLALILIDAIYDMYVIDYFNNLEFNLREMTHSINGLIKTYEKINATSNKNYKDTINSLNLYNKDLKNIEHNKLYYQNRIKYLFKKENILTKNESETVILLHSYRNSFLHQAKNKTSYLKPLVYLYYELLTTLFINIKVSCVTSYDNENKYLKGLFIFDKDPRKKAIKKINRSYNINFDFHTIKKLLVDFLEGEILSMENSINFILECLEEPPKVAKKLSKDFCLGEYKENKNEYLTTYEYDIIKKLHKKTQNLNEVMNYNDSLKVFNNLFKTITDLALPINNEARDIEIYIEAQADIMRGK